MTKAAWKASAGRSEVGSARVRGEGLGSGCARRGRPQRDQREQRVRVWGGWCAPPSSVLACCSTVGADRLSY